MSDARFTSQGKSATGPEPYLVQHQFADGWDAIGILRISRVRNDMGPESL